MVAVALAAHYGFLKSSYDKDILLTSNCQSKIIDDKTIPITYGRFITPSKQVKDLDWKTAQQVMIDDASSLNEQLKIVPSVVDILHTYQDQKFNSKNDLLKEAFALTREQILHIARVTTGQSDSPLWKKLREHRLTASNFGVVLKAWNRDSFPPSFYKRLRGE